MSAHSKLAASAAHRWIVCPGSIGMSAGEPDSQSAAAEEGTAAHAFLELALRRRFLDKKPSNVLKPGYTFKYEVESAQYGRNARFKERTADANMVKHVGVAVEHVATLLKEYPGAGLHLELPLSLSHIRPDMGGTADIVITLPQMLIVIDFKYGFIPVKVTQSELFTLGACGELHVVVNPQLLMYAAGALELFDPMRVDYHTVQLEIIQPRCMEVEPIQSAVLTSASVMHWAENHLWEAACNTEMANAPLVAGEHCRFCPAQYKCPELTRHANELAGADFTEIAAANIRVPDDPSRLSKILKAAPIVDSWLRACEERAHQLMSNGVNISGFKLVKKRSSREFPEGTKPIAVAKALGVKVGEVMTEPELMSPAQLEKRHGKKKKIVDAINSIATKPDTGTTIAAESDRREAVDPAGDFGELL